MYIIIILARIRAKRQNQIFHHHLESLFLTLVVVTTISLTALLTVLHHKYFSVNNSYFSVPIIYKCWSVWSVVCPLRSDLALG